VRLAPPFIVECGRSTPIVEGLRSGLMPPGSLARRNARKVQKKGHREETSHRKNTGVLALAGAALLTAGPAPRAEVRHIGTGGVTGSITRSAVRCAADEQGSPKTGIRCSWSDRRLAFNINTTMAAS